MANTTRHVPADVAAMSANELAMFIGTDYDGLQEYAKLLAIAKDHTTAGRTAPAAQTTLIANEKRGKLGY